MLRPNGSRLWRWNCRFQGKRKTLALGAYPELGLKDARTQRDEARKQLSEGIDPSAERKASKQAQVRSTENTFESVARRWWDEHAPTWSPAYAARVKATPFARPIVAGEVFAMWALESHGFKPPKNRGLVCTALLRPLACLGRF
jgi:hypothetical protein